ncbi:hypothetical protein ACHHYP_10081 [Achlya hypogyna]|uniref:RAVE complex protein Rav1 C-terminal domain-containing protein n=1 Tax=Achlya hypogyna TaxID=1202772 RepID=A0A1V9ZIL6_ACHHY|nr:hypothetical protein ACHHYP_10081 [Achlya hypogyna]
MLEERVTVVGAASPSPQLVVICDLFNYRWVVHASEASMALVFSRGALHLNVDPVRAEAFEVHQVLPLPALPQSIAFHGPSFRVAVACVDGRAMVFGPSTRTVPLIDHDIHWQCDMTWRCEPNMEAPLQWCDTKDDLLIVGAGTKVTSWKVVNDAVLVYPHRSFGLRLEAPAHLAKVSGNGRYVATGATAQSRLIKQPPRRVCFSGTPAQSKLSVPHSLQRTAPHCVLDWVESARHVDNATLLTLDMRGDMTLWREDSSAFAFVRMVALDTTSVLSHHTVNMLACGSVDVPAPRRLNRLVLDDDFQLAFLPPTPTLVDDNVYGPTMDRFGTAGSKAAGFFFRPGATADTHEGEPFIPGNVALAKCAVVYLLYSVLGNGDVCLWRVDCISLLMASPRSVLLGTFAGLRKLLRTATIFRVASPNFTSTSVYRLRGSKRAALGSATHFDVEVHLQSRPVGDLHRVLLHARQLPEGDWALSLVAAIDVYPSMGAHAAVTALLAPIDAAAPVVGFVDTHRTLFCVGDDAALHKLSHPPLELCHVRFPAATVVTSVVVVTADLVLCATTEREVLALCGYDAHAKAHVLTLATTPATLAKLLLVGDSLLGLDDRGTVHRWTLRCSDGPPTLVNGAEWAVGWSDVRFAAAWALSPRVAMLAVTAPAAVATWSLATGAPLHTFDVSACRCEGLAQRGDGSVALLLEDEGDAAKALRGEARRVQVHLPCDAVAAEAWPVDGHTSAIVWLKERYVLCLAQGALTLYSGPTALWTTDGGLGDVPAALLVHEGMLWVSRGALVSTAMVLPRETAPPAVWPPVLMFQLLRRGAFKALGRYFDALAAAVEAHEEACYVHMHAAPAFEPPQLSWAAIMFDPATGREDVWRPAGRRAVQKDCAALLFAPSVAAARAPAKKDYGAFWTPARLALLGPTDDGATLVSLATMLKLVDPEVLEDVPGMKFALALLWREETYAGLGAEAILWARLSAMDFFAALPWLQAKKWTWLDVRDLRLPFWLADVGKLREKTEQVAQSEYTATKDPFQVALYYVLLGKTRLLAGLFRLAKEPKIAELLANDFAEDRWRTAAIKNAFVLKSKGRFTLAATFFLLGSKVYEAVAMAEAADPTLVLACLICRLAEPADASGSVTAQFVSNMVLPRARACHDVYLEALGQHLLTNDFPHRVLLTPPTAPMSCGFGTTGSRYWRSMSQSLYAACALIRFDFGRRTYEDADTARVAVLHVMAASRLLGQDLPRAAYRCCSDLFESFGDLAPLEAAAAMLQRAREATVCAQLDQLAERLERIAVPVTEAPEVLALEQLTASLAGELEAFPSVPLPIVAGYLQQEHPMLALLAAHAAGGVAVPLARFLRVVLAGGAPWAALRDAACWTTFLHVAFALGTEPDSGTIRLATTGIYSAVCLALPAAVAALDACCVRRLVRILFPQKELRHERRADQCYVCDAWRPAKAPKSLRHDLPGLHALLVQLLTLQPKWPAHRAAPAPAACACVAAFVATAFHAMADHAARILGDQAEPLSRQWAAWARDRPRVLPQLCGECPWRRLTEQLQPALVRVVDKPGSATEAPVASLECIYRSQVPGEPVKAMCFNPEQRSTVVFCNGRFLYRSTAKKPRRDAPPTDLSPLCQLQVTARFAPPQTFATDVAEVPKAGSPLSPTPDSRTTSYRPIALAAHPELPVFCTGTVKGSVELWRFDDATKPAGAFEHPVPSSNPLTQLSAPRRDVHRIRFENTGHMLGACDNVGFVYLWNFATSGAPACYAHLQCHNRGTRDFTFLNASSCLASVGASTKKKNLCLWDTLLPPQRALISAPVCHPLGATAVVFSSRHQLLISGGESGGLSVFDVRRQRMLHTVSGAHDSAIMTLVLHPKGHCVLSGSATGDVKIWALPLFRELAAWLTGKAKPVVATFLGDTTSAFVAPTITGVTDAFATDDFFYTSHSDGSIQRCQVPVAPPSL